MKFVIESLSKCSPRLGYLQKNEDLVLHSPLLLQHTKSSIIPFLSQEVFNYVTTEPQAYSICVDSTIHMSEALSLHQKGVASFAGLGPNCITFLTIKNPSEVCKTGFHEKDVLSIYTRTGRKTISADQYMDLVQSHKPDIFHALCDGDTNDISSNKRTIKSAERTKEFFDRCLQRYRNAGELKNHSLFVAPIEGGYNMKSRENLIKEFIANNAEIDGYFLDGFHNNGITATNMQINSIKDIVQRCNELLPANKFKVMLGSYNPVMTMELIELGVDVFDSSYSYLATKYNCALTFAFNLEVATGSREYDMDLSDIKYKEDFTPILPDCMCLACQKHTRAYVYHLINTRELLSTILLMIHNTHQYIEFFKSIRKSVSNGTLKQLIQLVEAQFVKRCLLEENIMKQIELEKDKEQKKDEKQHRRRTSSQS